MSNDANEDGLDRIRKTALDDVEKRDRTSWYLLIAAAVVEATGIILFLVLMDFSDRLHWLIFIAACLVYGTVVLALASFSAEARTSEQRILRAIEELGRPTPSPD
ncbi:MAG: hypothetical protein AAF560_23500 [Acidobacteriota bacterium]